MHSNNNTNKNNKNKIEDTEWMTAQALVMKMVMKMVMKLMTVMMMRPKKIKENNKILKKSPIKTSIFKKQPKNLVKNPKPYTIKINVQWPSKPKSKNSNVNKPELPNKK
jgi:uncharacterized protein VirK/YbjX